MISRLGNLKWESREVTSGRIGGEKTLINLYTYDEKQRKVQKYSKILSTKQREWINWIIFTLWANLTQRLSSEIRSTNSPFDGLSLSNMKFIAKLSFCTRRTQGTCTSRFWVIKPFPSWKINTNLYVVNFNLLQPSQKFTLRAFDFQEILIKLSSCSRSRSLDGSSLTATPVRFVHESTQNKKSAELRSLLPFVVYLFHFSARGENFIYFRWAEHSFWLLKNIYFSA